MSEDTPGYLEDTVKSPDLGSTRRALRKRKNEFGASLKMPFKEMLAKSSKKMSSDDFVSVLVRFAAS